MLAKVFQGKFLNEIRKEMKRNFDFCKASKPEASRKESAETYLIGKEFISG